MDTFDAWLVDLDGTLYKPLGVKLGMAAELALGLPRGHLRTARLLQRFRQEHEHLREHPELLDGTASPFALQLQRAAADLDASADVLEQLVSEWMLRRPGKWIRLFRRRELLNEIAGFHRGGGKTALVSDYPARPKLEALQAADLFDAVVTNGEDDRVRTLKPSPDAFLLAAERLEVKPRRCLVVGDREDADGEAARRAGMAFRKV